MLISTLVNYCILSCFYFGLEALDFPLIFASIIILSQKQDAKIIVASMYNWHIKRVLCEVWICDYSLLFDFST